MRMLTAIVLCLLSVSAWYVAQDAETSRDYARGGMRVLPIASGDTIARRVMLAYTVGLVAASVVPTLLGTTGVAYAVTAVALGAVFVALAAAALSERDGKMRARRVFLYSLLYLPVLLSVLVLDAQ